MPGTNGHNRVLRCAACGAENYPFAAFCISCGEPFDDAPLLDVEPESSPAVSADSERSVSFSPSTPFSSYSPTKPALPPAGVASPQASLSVSPVGRLHRRETVLGVVLVVVALSLAIFNWQRDTTQSAAYRQGIVAEQTRDWDKAATFFEQAGDHPEADGKARNARLQVSDRNRLYVDGVTAAGQGDWKGAADAMATVEAIQPDFADSASRLVQARSRAFKLEMGGMVYLVSSGAAQGLYVLDKDGNPSKLPGSDGQSSLRAG